MQGLQDIGMSYKNLASRVVPWFRLAKRDAAKGGGVPCGCEVLVDQD